MGYVVSFGVQLFFEIMKWMFTDDNLGPQAKTGRVDLDLRGRLLGRIQLQQGEADRLRTGRQPGADSGGAQKQSGVGDG